MALFAEILRPLPNPITTPLSCCSITCTGELRLMKGLSSAVSRSAT